MNQHFVRNQRIASFVATAAVSLSLAIATSSAPAAAQVAPPAGVTAVCNGVKWMPPVIPDINGGMAFHLTFTMSQLLANMQQLCQEEQQAQMMAMDFQSFTGDFLDAPGQLRSMFGAGAGVDPGMANVAQSNTVLGQLQADAAKLQQVEQLMTEAQGNTQQTQVGTMLSAIAATELQKLETLQASDVMSNNAMSVSAGTSLENSMSAPSPDFGDGFML